jgi:hypothetical protein
MDGVSREELKKLIQKPEGWCVSIYMATHRVSPETKQNPIRKERGGQNHVAFYQNTLPDRFQRTVV